MTESYLILARHGNTFETGQTATWVGARTDMPLTQQGLVQAQNAAYYIAEQFPTVESIVAGPLQRTRRMAEIIGKKIGKNMSVDSRLCEIDYGKWEDLSSEEIAKRYGQAVLDQWEKQGVFPEDMEWKPSFEALQDLLRAFLAEQDIKFKTGSAPRLAVTSNGVLRLIHALVTGVQGDPVAKVKTGHLCVLSPSPVGWQIVAWNVKPPA